MKKKFSFCKKKMSLYLEYPVGSHMCFEKKICNTIWSAVCGGLNAVQFFMGNQRSFDRAKIDFDDIKICKKIIYRYPTHIFTHFPYTANFAGSVSQLAWDGDIIQDKKTKHILNQLHYEASVLANFDNVKNGVVIHPGSFPDKKKGIQAIGKSLNMIDFKNDDNSMIILENCAGEGSKIPSTLQELKEILSYIDEDKQKHFSVCIDTCHLFAVGDYDLCEEKEIDRFFSDFDTILGLDKLTLFHLNDSEKKKGSCVDRHASLGFGYIWKENFNSLKKLLDRCEKENIPCILETERPDIDIITISKLKN